jgi:hypothetical protein
MGPMVVKRSSRMGRVRTGERLLTTTAVLGEDGGRREGEEVEGGEVEGGESDICERAREEMAVQGRYLQRRAVKS